MNFFDICDKVGELKPTEQTQVQKPIIKNDEEAVHIEETEIRQENPAPEQQENPAPTNESEE